MDMKPKKRCRKTAARSGVLGLLLLVLMSLSACGGADVESAPQEDPMQMQRVYQAPLTNYYIGPGVRLVSDSDDPRPMKLAANVFKMPDEALAVADVDEQGIRVPLKDMAYLRNRQVGDILIASSNGVYWRRIVEVEERAGELYWKTETASMSEVFEDAEFYMQVDLRKVRPDQIPDIDLAMPYLDPENPPQLLNTRKGGLGDGGFQEDDCPVAPTCNQNSSHCVSKKNEDIICPEDDDGTPCDERTFQDHGCKTKSGWAGSLNSGTNAYGLSSSKGLKKLRCVEIAGVQRLAIADACTEDSDCSGSTMACHHVAASFHGAPSQCLDAGAECSDNGDCCSANCDPDANRCAPSTDGYCMTKCAGGGMEDTEYDGDDETSSGLFDLFNQFVGSDSFIKKVKVDANFKPSLTFKLKVDLKGLKLLKLTVGSDFFFGLGFDFKFEKHWAKQVEAETTIPIFGFAVMGYPFTINLDLHAMAEISAAIEGTFKPRFGFYTYATDALWEEEHDELGPYPDSHLPYKWDDDAEIPGIEMGFAVSRDGSVCDGYEEDECRPSKDNGKFYLISRFRTDKYFDPGIDFDIDVHAAAEAGAGVGLYDGVNTSTRYIGVEPLNLLARAYARFQGGFCGIGFKVYYSALVKVGPIKLFGINLIKDAIPLPLVRKKIDAISFDFRMPDDINKDCEGDDSNHWLCVLSDLMDCGTSVPEPIIPGQAGAICVEHEDCLMDDGQRCINQKCLEDVQPPGSLRFSLSWTEYKNLDIEVRTPDGKVITRNDSTYANLFAGTCSNPLEPGDACNELDDLYGESLTLGGNGAALTPGIYDISVTSSVESNSDTSAETNHFVLEIEEEGVGRRSVEGQFIQDGNVAKAPISFEYEVK